MVEVIRGQIGFPAETAAALVESVQSLNLEGVLFLGYPVRTASDQRVDVDALLLTQEHGLLAFRMKPHAPAVDPDAWAHLVDEQDQIYFALRTTLERNPRLREGRRLVAEPNVATVFLEEALVPPLVEGLFWGLNELTGAIAALPGVPPEHWSALLSSIQQVTTFRPQKRREHVVATTRGGKIKQIEAQIATLDKWQNQAAIETPEGPQRVRGLAGSGKTVVLALKAAYLHTEHPDWRIAVVFYTRSLYQQFTELIRRFTFDRIADEPNWDRLQLLHAWGGADRPGMYLEIARAMEAPPRDFNYARAKYRNDEFRGVCRELLDVAGTRGGGPEMFDAVLIDEGQDLPEEFFQLVYRVCKPPKRVIFAYDELQKLSEAVMPSPADLFGLDRDGNARVELRNDPGMPRQDVTLPRCYRNTPWALALAHALGFGIYRDGIPVQNFDNPHRWEEIGYERVSGQLVQGSDVELERARSATPDFFYDLLHPDDAVQAMAFDDEVAQAAWVAEEVHKNLTEDQLEPDDVLIVLPDALTARRSARTVLQALEGRGIPGHLAGVTSSRDELFAKGSVAIANIYRSKGNEAPVVYVLNSQQCLAGYEMLRLRNTLFTAITRSRAWVRVLGWGPAMVALMEEIRAVREHEFRLAFRVPTPDELQQMRNVHRERTADELDRFKRWEESLRELLEAVRAGDIELDSLSAELRTGIAQLGAAEREDFDDRA